MRIFVTYSTPNYFKARNLAARMAKLFGRFDKIVLYSPDDIDTDFKKNNSDILKIERGAGLWLWKPYSIYKALLEEAEDGDYVFYCDAASFFIRNCNYIIRTMYDNDIWVSESNFIEEFYTKEDAFHILNCTDDKYRKTNQIQAQFFCARKSSSSTAFVKEWLDNACNYSLICPENVQSGFENVACFVEHRFDQSILSLLVKKHEIKPHFSPLGISHLNKCELSFTNRISACEREYPCCIILQHSANVNVKYSFVTILKVLTPKVIISFMRWLKC